VSDPEHILVSLEPRHAQNILSGEKHVELRRRSMNVAAGATMWIYAKLPIGSIVGQATVGAVDASSPQDLWKRYGAVSGLTKMEFFDYFEGRDIGVALVLGARSVLEEALSLTDLREVDDGFHPPQFFTRLEPTHPVRHAVLQASKRATRRKEKHPQRRRTTEQRSLT
jgi:predicted transcriptional regulator